jgi:PAS domain S-box-containing protein
MLHILLIDDEPQDRVLVRRKLEREFSAVQITEIVKAEELSQVLETVDFDLTITDYQLRWTDGLAVVRSLKARYPDRPVMMFTNSGSEEIAVEAMKAGVDDYVLKSPTHFTRLVTAVHLALERVEERRRACRLELRLQSLLNRLDVGVFRSTLEGQLLEANLAFMELLGVNTLADAHSLNLQELLLHPQERSQLLEQLRQDKQLPARQVELHRADGTQICVSCSQTLSTTEGETFVDGLVEDISDRKRIEKALQHSREKYRALVIAATQVVWTSDAQGQTTSVTESWQSLFGQTEEEFKGWGWLNVIHPDEREEVIRRWNQAVATSRFYESEQRMRVVDGSYRDFLVRGVPVREADGSLREWVGTCTDITERKQAQLSLKQAKEELEIRVAERTAELKRANEQLHLEIAERQKAEITALEAWEKERELSELKSRIITTISHEYRTPLTTIQGSAEILENYSDRLSPERQLLHLQRIQTSVKHMTKLVNDALFIGKAEADKLEFNPTLLDLEQFCRELVEEMRSDARRQTTIILNSRGNCANACLDEKLLRQILSNLLSNAIKYSPQGSTIRFDLECVDEIVQFRIQDSGIGIPEADFSSLFESFHRASNVGTIPGTGVGLAIVKKCVDLQGGEITVKSAVDVGTTFTVTLPLLISHSNNTCQPPKSPSSGGREKIRFPPELGG